MHSMSYHMIVPDDTVVNGYARKNEHDNAASLRSTLHIICMNAGAQYCTIVLRVHVRGIWNSMIRIIILTSKRP